MSRSRWSNPRPYDLAAHGPASPDRGDGAERTLRDSTRDPWRRAARTNSLRRKVGSQESANAQPLEPAGVTDEDDTGACLRRLVQSAQASAAEAFGAIFDEFHLPVYRYILARVENTADAEDLAAETFAAAFRAIGSFRWQGAPFEAWLFRIARSKVIDHYRRRDRRATQSLSGIEPAAVRGADPATAILHEEQRGQVLAAVRRLSADQQEVVALRFFADLSVPEVARVMDRSAGAVRQLQLRALTTLRQRMERLR